MDGRQGRRLGRHAAARQGRRDQRPVVQRPATARQAGVGEEDKQPTLRRSNGHAERAPRVVQRAASGYADRGLSVRRGRRRRRRRCRRCGRIRSSPSRSPHPVLDAARWQTVVDDRAPSGCSRPIGLRTLAPGDPDYKPHYDGDLRARDAAYHQGTVWAWLIGPFVDAWLKVHPRPIRRRRATSSPASQHHLGEACIGSISEIFDAEAPYTPRGCVAQAWSVAEVLRSWVKTDAGECRGPPVKGRAVFLGWAPTTRCQCWPRPIGGLVRVWRDPPLGNFAGNLARLHARLSTRSGATSSSHFWGDTDNSLSVLAEGQSEGSCGCGATDPLATSWAISPDCDARSAFHAIRCDLQRQPRQQVVAATHEETVAPLTSDQRQDRRLHDLIAAVRFRGPQGRFRRGQ